MVLQLLLELSQTKSDKDESFSSSSDDESLDEEKVDEQPPIPPSTPPNPPTPATIYSRGILSTVDRAEKVINGAVEDELFGLAAALPNEDDVFKAILQNPLKSYIANMTSVQIGTNASHIEFHHPEMDRKKSNYKSKHQRLQAEEVELNQVVTQYLEKAAHAKEIYNDAMRVATDSEQRLQGVRSEMCKSAMEHAKLQKDQDVSAVLYKAMKRLELLHTNPAMRTNFPYAKYEMGSSEMADLATTLGISDYESTELQYSQHMAIARVLKIFGWDYSPASKAAALEGVLQANNGRTLAYMREQTCKCFSIEMKTHETPKKKRRRRNKSMSASGKTASRKKRKTSDASVILVQSLLSTHNGQAALRDAVARLNSPRAQHPGQLSTNVDEDRKCAADPNGP